MAILDPTITGRKPAVEEGDNAMLAWSPLVDTSDPTAISTFRDFTDRTAQVSGTFGGATVEIHGSLDGVTYAALTDPQGNTVSFSQAGVKAIVEATPYLKPVVSGAGALTELKVMVYVRRST